MNSFVTIVIVHRVASESPVRVPVAVGILVLDGFDAQSLQWVEHSRGGPLNVVEHAVRHGRELLHLLVVVLAVLVTEQPLFVVQVVEQAGRLLPLTDVGHVTLQEDAVRMLHSELDDDLEAELEVVSSLWLLD